jgi:hypothetical protein
MRPGKGLRPLHSCQPMVVRFGETLHAPRQRTASSALLLAYAKDAVHCTAVGDMI